MTAPIQFINNQPTEANVTIQQEQNHVNWHGCKVDRSVNQNVNPNIAKIYKKIIIAVTILTTICLGLSIQKFTKNDEGSSGEKWLLIATDLGIFNIFLILRYLRIK